MRVCGGQRSTLRRKELRGVFWLFQLADTPVTLHASWKQLGLEGGKHLAQNVWSEGGFKESKEVSVTLRLTAARSTRSDKRGYEPCSDEAFYAERAAAHYRWPAVEESSEMIGL